MKKATATVIETWRAYDPRIILSLRVTPGWIIIDVLRNRAMPGVFCVGRRCIVLHLAIVPRML